MSKVFVGVCGGCFWGWVFCLFICFSLVACFLFFPSDLKEQINRKKNQICRWVLERRAQRLPTLAAPAYQRSDSFFLFFFASAKTQRFAQILLHALRLMRGKDKKSPSRDRPGRGSASRGKPLCLSLQMGRVECGAHEWHVWPCVTSGLINMILLRMINFYYN